MLLFLSLSRIEKTTGVSPMKNCLKNIIRYCLLIFGFFSKAKAGGKCVECFGKVDAGPTFIHVDVLEFNKTVKKLDMGGVKADASIQLWKGIYLKPCVIYGNGQGEIISSGLGIGHYTPIIDKLYLTPIVGASYTQLQTTINLDMLGLRHLKERFRSLSPYLALEISYCFCPGFRICAQYQYAWSRTHTTIKHLTHSKSHSRGSNYSAMIEYDLNQKWSVNFGGAYNESLTREKHGLRAYGFKTGLAYWF
jgi:hypothetical protein